MKSSDTLNVGDKIIWKPIDYRDKSQDIGHRWYGAKGTVLEIISLNRAIISIDNFPECNNRETVNRFCADFEELERYEE